MQDVHPSDCLGVVDLAEIDLGSPQILMPQDNFDTTSRGDVDYGAIEPFGRFPRCLRSFDDCARLEVYVIRS